MDYKQKYLKYKMKYLQTKKLFKQEHYLRGGAATSDAVTDAAPDVVAVTNSSYINEEEFNKLPPVEKFCYGVYYKTYKVKVDLDIDSEEYSPPVYILLSEYISKPDYNKFYDNTVLYYRKKEQDEIDAIIARLRKDNKNNNISEEQYLKLDKSTQFLYYKIPDKTTDSNLVDFFKSKEKKQTQEPRYILNNSFLIDICSRNM